MNKRALPKPRRSLGECLILAILLLCVITYIAAFAIGVFHTFNTSSEIAEVASGVSQHHGS